MRVIHRARGWHAVWSGWTLKRSLPGDTPAVVSALHALNAAGVLPLNKPAEGWPIAPCPRCGRATAIARWGDLPSVCTGCRAEFITERNRSC
jgi:hypothetical protein